MRTIVPPLKCQGIKTKLVPWIRELAENEFSCWIEPFMGSGVVGFNINPERAIFADSNPHIIRFYTEIQKNQITGASARVYLKAEGETLRRSPNNGYDHYHFIRDRFNESFDPLDFLFLSRAGFNGMMRFSKSGKWNIPFCKKPDRFAQAYITKICNQIDACAKSMRPDWQFICQGYADTIAQATKDDLIYCDPPYLGRYTDYYNNWTEADEERLATLLRNTPAKFILSSWHHNEFRTNTFLEKYWSGYNIVTRNHFYHSGAKEENRNSIVEALVFNFERDKIAMHNHGVRNKPEQLMFFDQMAKYSDQQVVPTDSHPSGATGKVSRYISGG